MHRITFSIRSRSLASLLALTAALPSASPLEAQGASPRPTPRDTMPRDTIAAVVVRATRAGSATPTSQTTLDRKAIERTHVGQDAPLALQGLPSVTASSDAGAFSGYSAIRLRGIDQTRLAISLDGVPLNDPEDQVLYFSNVPDFMNSMESVRVQRGVGSSAFGTAAFGGSLSFESISLATTPRFAEAQVTGGSWGTGRASVEGATGLASGWAAYGRVSGQETDGYRAHSGNRAHSAFASAGWFGARDAVRFTGFAGRSRMQLAYYAPSEAELAVDPRANPMSPQERDDFHQEMASLQHTRSFGERLALTTTAYRNSAAGAYDVVVGSELWNFNLDHVWYGVLSTLSWSRPGLDVAAGAHLSTYERDHFLRIRPDLSARVYDNTGFKQEQSAFVKATWTRGMLDWHGDLQVRRAAFRYRPTPGGSAPDPTVDWIFLNPKVGLTWRARPGVAVHASVGRSSREPTRSDLFAGADDLDASNASELLPLDQVRPEHVVDVEVGTRLQRRDLSVEVNLFTMRFRDEIAPIGALSITGSQLRRNVDRSRRSGLEVDGRWRFHLAWTFTANATAMRARIAEFRDEASGTTYRDVPPLLSPALLLNAALAWQPARGPALSAAARHVSRSQLANDGNAALTTPAYTIADLSAEQSIGGHAVRLQVQNAFDARAYASGYTDGTTRYFFPVATRTVLATLVIRF